MNATDLIARLERYYRMAVVVARALVTILVALATAVTAVVAEIGDEIPGAVRVGAYIVAGLGAAVTILRRVTPVDKAERGILSE